MTIHHDKLAYGKLAPNMEEMSQEQLAEMLKLLNEQDENKTEQSTDIEKPHKNIKKY